MRRSGSHEADPGARIGSKTNFTKYSRFATPFLCLSPQWFAVEILSPRPATAGRLRHKMRSTIIVSVVMHAAMVVLGLLVGPAQAAFLQNVLPLSVVLTTPSELLGNETQEINMIGRTTLTLGVAIRGVRRAAPPRVAEHASPCARSVAGDCAAGLPRAEFSPAPPPNNLAGSVQPPCHSTGLRLWEGGAARLHGEAAGTLSVWGSGGG